MTADDSMLMLLLLMTAVVAPAVMCTSSTPEEPDLLAHDILKYPTFEELLGHGVQYGREDVHGESGEGSVHARYKRQAVKGIWDDICFVGVQL